MHKKLIMVLFSVGLFALGGVYWVYRNVPPYYYQSKLFFILNKSDLQALADRFSKDKNFNYLELANGEIVEVEVSTDSKKPLKGDVGEIYKNYLLEARVSPIWKTQDGFLFYIGADRKFGKDFQIAYVKLNKEAVKEYSCDSQFRVEGPGSCLISLDKEWSLQYEWM